MEAASARRLPVAFALLLVANLTPGSERADPILQEPVPAHPPALAFFGYAALFVAFAMGVLYLIQERELKARSPRAFYYLIPSLERCDTISGRSVVVGFGFLTLAIVTGLLWSHSRTAATGPATPRSGARSSAWVIYVGLILARAARGLGRPAGGPAAASRASRPSCSPSSG